MVTPLAPQSIFKSSLLDAAGQPNLIINSAQAELLTWTLVNNAEGPDQDLVVTPFGGGTVGPDQYHFKFDFTPGTLTLAPTLEGWEVAVETVAASAIATVYIALAGATPLEIAPGALHTARLTYANAVQRDANNPKVAINLTAGSQVALGGAPIPGQGFGPFDLTLVPADMPAQSVPPLALDFVGRRAVLNDGATGNSFTFALTNMAQAALPLNPKVSEASLSPTVFTVWFDAAPNGSDHGYPWALAKIQDLASSDVVLGMPSVDWHWVKAVTEPNTVPGNPQWTITVDKPVSLGPQDPILFKFSGLKTDLDPGITRMYLRYESLPGFHDGVLIGELEKTPMFYGAVQGQGLYVSAGTPRGQTPPAPSFDSGLTVRQFGIQPSATFRGGQGVVIEVEQGPAASLSGGALINVNNQPIEALRLNAAGVQAALAVKQTGTGLAVQVEGNTTLHGALQAGETKLTGTLEVALGANVIGKATVGSLDVSVGATVKDTLKVESRATVKALETTSDGAVIRGALTAENGAVINGLLTANNGAQITGPMSARGPVSLFGNYQALPVNTSYSASTDGIVFASILGADPNDGFSLTILSGRLNGQWVSHASGGTSMGSGKVGIRDAACLSFPVPKGGSWMVGRWDSPSNQTTAEVNVFWMPIGSSENVAEAERVGAPPDALNVAERPWQELDSAMNMLVDALSSAISHPFNAADKEAIVKAIKRLL